MKDLQSADIFRSKPHNLYLDDSHSYQALSLLNKHANALQNLFGDSVVSSFVETPSSTSMPVESEIFKIRDTLYSHM